MNNLKFILTLLYLVPVVSYAQSGWQEQNNPSGEVPETIYFTSENNGWISTDDEYIMWTTDGGQNWNKVNMSDLDSFNNLAGCPDIYFFDDKKGWVISTVAEGTLPRFTYGGLAYSTDGGKNWEVKWYSDTLYPRAFYWHDQNTGWAVGDDGLTLHTSDGGDSWKVVMVNSDYNLKDVHFKDVNNGWAVGGEENFGSTQEGYVLRTTDGGDSWNLQKTLVPPTSSANMMINSISFADDNNGWAEGLRTTDGGNSWSETSIIGNSINFRDANFGWYIGLNSVKMTTDGGSTWTEAVNFDSLPISIERAFFINPETGWVSSGSFYDGKIFHKGKLSSGIQDFSTSNEIDVYPNPFENTVSIHFNAQRRALPQTVTLFNIHGQKIKDYKLRKTKKGRNTFRFDMSNMSAGAYFVKIKHNYVKIVKN